MLDVAAVHDCGVMIDPALVTGQLKGAIVMGLGAALWEELTHDDGGRLVSDGSRPTSCRARTNAGHPRRPMATPSPSIRSASRARRIGLGGALAATTNAVATRWRLARGLTTVPATPPRLMAILAAGAAP